MGSLAQSWVVYASAALALLAVGVGPARRLLGHLSTAAHEGGHALAALACGYRLGGIRLHRDGSGLTWHQGPQRGPGRVLVAVAGYPMPPLLGLGAVALLTGGIDPLAILVGTLLVLGGLLLLVRNVFGAFALLVLGMAIALLTYRADAGLQRIAGYLISWFLILNACREVAVLRAVQRSGAEGSDADQLHRVTGVPGWFWEGFFAVVAAGCLLSAVLLVIR